MSARMDQVALDLAAESRRARVLELVRARSPVDDRETAARRAFLGALGRLATPFDRWADPVHVTASAVVVGDRGVVLLKHRRIGRWLQPGGHVEPGEDPEDAAVRECMEETGLPVAHPAGGPRLVHLDVHGASGHVHLDLRYLLGAPGADPAPGPGESQEVRWFDWRAAEAIADDALSGALRAARRWSDTVTGGAARDR